MKKLELESIKRIVAQGNYRITPHSYGTSGMGYLVNYKLVINDVDHIKKYNRQVYYICFSSKNWYKVKYTGTYYNNRFLEKYAYYDEKIEGVIYGDNKTLASKLV